METLAIAPAVRPLTGEVHLPGSKSLTNRALALAALAPGKTLLVGALFADDTQRMQDCLRALGFSVEGDEARKAIAVEGGGGQVPATQAQLFVGNSGTSARFLAPLAALGHGSFTIDGVERMRARPIADLAAALSQLGVEVHCPSGCPPLTIQASGLRGGECRLRADTSSQFLSGLLLAAPLASGPTQITVEGPILSAPYIEMTLALVRAFGGEIGVFESGRRYEISGGQRYKSPGTFAIEPDASAASYFWAAAALTGGTVRTPGLTRASLQGDVAFVEVLSALGCAVEDEPGGLSVSGPERLGGGTFDMNAISDTVMTLAALAPFASEPIVIENVAHIRHKETDRLSAIATELSRLGVRCDERAGGITIYPTERLRPATVQTYDDHRMAMAFSLIGLKAPGVAIADPGCVNKTFPGYFAALEALR